MILIKIHNYLANDDDPTIDGYLMYSIRQNIIMSCVMIKMYLCFLFDWCEFLNSFNWQFNYYYIIRWRHSNYKSINGRLLRCCAWFDLLFVFQHNLIGQSLKFRIGDRRIMQTTMIIIHTIFDTRIRVSFQCFLFLLE